MSTSAAGPDPAACDTPVEKSELDRLIEWAGAQTCPGCGHSGLRIEMRLLARPLGTFSLAGAQDKVSASEVPFLICDGCGASAQGHR